MQRILCITFEGDPLYNVGAETALEKAGFEVKGKNYLNPHFLGQRFDLVIQFGLSAREDDGIACLKVIQVEFPKAKLLVVSGHLEPLVISKVKEAGADFFERRHGDDVEPLVQYIRNSFNTKTAG